MVTTSSTRPDASRSVSAPNWTPILTHPDADVRIPLHEGSYLRGQPVDKRRPADEMPGLRQPRAARAALAGGPLQGLRLLQHRLRHPQPPARAEEQQRSEIRRLGLE